jgi:lactoylglutathione lyase
MFQTDDGESGLTCLEYGDGYLMIEQFGIAGDGEKDIEQSPMKLRFHVADMQAVFLERQALGINAKLNQFSWGSTINVSDPDGNRIGIRDEGGFQDQIQSWRASGMGVSAGTFHKE